MKRRIKCSHQTDSFRIHFQTEKGYLFQPEKKIYQKKIPSFYFFKVIR